MEKILEWNTNQDSFIGDCSTQFEMRKSQLFRFSTWKKQKSLHEKSLHKKPLLQLSELTENESRIMLTRQKKQDVCDKKCWIRSLNADHLLMRFQGNKLFSNQKLRKVHRKSARNTFEIFKNNLNQIHSRELNFDKKQNSLPKRKKPTNVELLKNKLNKIGQKNLNYKKSHLSKEKSLPLIKYYQRRKISKVSQQN